MFRINEAAEGVLHVQDALGVCFTLLRGSRGGLLVDTGYGLESVKELADGLVRTPYRVALTHGHHDHILGAAEFREVWLCPEDLEEYRLRSGEAQRAVIADRARQAGIPVPSDYLTRSMPEPEALTFPDRCLGFESRRVDLGGLTAELIHVPGHTPGSVVVWIPERELLLTGDDWNPCTWLWFPSSLGVRSWRANMEQVLQLPFTRVLCSHQPAIRERKEIEGWFSWLTEETVNRAPAVNMGSEIRTRKASLPEQGFEFVFDGDKRDQ